MADCKYFCSTIPTPWLEAGRLSCEGRTGALPAGRLPGPAGVADNHDPWSSWLSDPCLAANTRGPLGFNDAASLNQIAHPVRLEPAAAFADGGVSLYPFDTPNLRRCMTATILAEAVDGQEGDIRWIYLNHVAQKGNETGLRVSTAYREKGLWYRIWLYMLGDSTHAHDALPKVSEQDKASFALYADLGDCCQRNEWFRTTAAARAARAVKLVDDMFSGANNPFQGWNGQGNVSDFNRNEPHWKTARAYYFLMQKDPAKYPAWVKRLKAGASTQFIFDGKRIEAFFKQKANQGLLTDVVPPYAGN